MRCLASALLYDAPVPSLLAEAHPMSAPAAPVAAPGPLTTIWAPTLFVFLWESGYIAAKYTIGYAQPFTILLLRFGIVIGVMAPVVVLGRAPWPRSWGEAGHVAVVGVLLQAVYLGGIYAGLERGVPAGVMALIMALQPIITATLVGPLLGERVTLRQWLGLLLGLGGVGLVLANKIHFDFDGWMGLFFSFIAVSGITAATLYQKRFCGETDWRTGTIIQYLAAAAVTAPITLAEGIGTVSWSPTFLLALTWIVFVLAVGTYNLFLWLIHRNAAAKLTSLLYLVPPMTALAGYVAFGETLGPLSLLGMALAALGVYAVVKK
jgi:drug/metabolite transporter (DMT)-like permease